MKLLESIKQIITEASKKKILMDKIGFNEENADILDQLCGPLSVWMANKIIQVEKQRFTVDDSDKTFELKYLIPDINDYNSVRKYRSRIQSIMDWIRVGLNGNVREYQDLSFFDLLGLSTQWHESLEVGQGDINYKEENPIILDFRDENGNGFYWVDLQTKNSSEECNRMGHCGRSSYGYLYSLRQVVPLNNKYKLNKSVLTAAIGEDGIMYQLKGPKNSKPEEKYHQYILPLFFVLGDPGEEDDYLIQGFGTEYDSEQDFKLTDLPEETIRDLYQNRPELFESRTMQRLLGRMGIVDVQELPTTFTLELSPEYLKFYVDGGWENRYRSKNGDTRNVHIFEEIMEGDAYGLRGHQDYHDFDSYFQYTIDDETENRLWNIVRRIAESDGIEIDEDTDLYGAIKEVDDDWEIRNAISGGIDDADADDYVNYLQRQLKSALEEYGNVYEFDDSGVKIQIDLSSFVDIESQEIDEVFENNYYPNQSQYQNTGGYNLEGVLDELLSNELIEQPTFDYDERWYPSPDDNIVNEQVNYRLDDID
jgi:hypothetical protein